MDGSIGWLRDVSPYRLRGSKAPVRNPQQIISTVGNSSGYGTVSLSVQWPKGKSRVIPEATEWIVARLKRSGMTL